MNKSLLDQLLLVINEEVAGMWELVAEGRNLYPGLTDAELRREAREVLRAALAERWVELVIGTLPSNEWQPILAEEVDGVLDDPINWHPPASHEAWHIRLRATDEGDREFRQRLNSGGAFNT